MNWWVAAGAFIAGCFLGVFFFGGLWWTVQRITDSDRPYLISIASFILRTAVVLAVLYLVLSAGYYYIFITFGGFLIARAVLTYRLKPEKDEKTKKG